MVNVGSLSLEGTGVTTGSGNRAGKSPAWHHLRLEERARVMMDTGTNVRGRPRQHSPGERTGAGVTPGGSCERPRQGLDPASVFTLAGWLPACIATQMGVSQGAHPPTWERRGGVEQCPDSHPEDRGTARSRELHQPVSESLSLGRGVYVHVST